MKMVQDHPLDIKSLEVTSQWLEKEGELGGVERKRGRKKRSKEEEEEKKEEDNNDDDNKKKK